MNKLAKLVSGLCLIGTSTAFASLAPIDSIDIFFDGYFEYNDVGGSNATFGDIEFAVYPDVIVSDPSTELQWCATGFMGFDFEVLDSNFDTVNSGFGDSPIGPIDLGVFSLSDLLSPGTIAGLQDQLDPLSIFGMNSTPLGLPVPTGAIGEFAFDFESFDSTAAFGPVPSLGVVDVYFEGVVTLTSKAPVTSKVPDATSTATLGMFAFGMMLAAKRFRNKKA